MTDDDFETPICCICGEHVGVHNDAVLILRGQFFMNKVDGYAMFVLDPDTKYAALELENALGPGQPQHALIIDPVDPDPIMPAHQECLDQEVQLDGFEEDEEEEEDEDEAELLDRQMREARGRDHHPDWDADDMFRGGQR